MIELASPRQSIDKETIDAAINVLKSGWYISGDRVAAFEEAFSRFCGTKSAVGVSSGTAALHLALLGCGVGAGDEVITTPFTFIATANAIVHTGAKPVFSEIDAETFNIDPSKIEEKITGRTKAIVPVHIYGHPVDMDPIMEIAQKHDLKVIEDACQAHGAEYNGRKIGSIGDAACFSFFPSKVMTVCGDGGMVTTSDEGVAEWVAMLRNQGRKPGEKYVHSSVGFNYRMSELPAAVGAIQLKHLPEWIEKRREIASMYNRLLGKSARVRTPVEKEWAKAVYYVYTILSGDREGLASKLKEEGIPTGVYYPVPVHKQPSYSAFNGQSFPISEKASSEILSLPMHPYLKKEDVSRIAEAITSITGD